MANRRMLARNVTTSKKVANLSSPWAKLFYSWLIPFCDDYGRFHADPDLLKSTIFPREREITELQIKEWRDELHTIGLIFLYSVNGSDYLEITQFEKFQTFRVDRKRQGEFPEPEKNINGIPVTYQCHTKNIPKTTDGRPKLREEKLREEKCLNKVNVGFEEFWKAYPRKVNKREAQEKWNKAKLPELAFILQIIEEQKKTDQWQRDNGKFIPYPSTWINKERWNDETEITSVKTEMRCSKCGEIVTSLSGRNRLCLKCNK